MFMQYRKFTTETVVYIKHIYIFTRPGAAGAVLQTLCYILIACLSLFPQTFKTLLHPDRKS